MWPMRSISSSPQPPSTIFVDSIGVGGGVADRLRELGYAAIDVAVSERATNHKKYLNRRAELYARFKEWLQAGKGRLPDDPELIAEATSVKYSFDSAGRLKIEKKEDLKKRGLPSPDKLDSVVLTFKELGFFSGCII